MKFSKILFAVMTFVFLTCTVAFAANSSTLSITPTTAGGSKINAGTKVTFSMKSSANGIVEIGYTIKYKATGIYRISDVKTVSGGTNYNYNVPFFNDNGKYVIEIYSKDSVGGRTDATFEYEVINGNNSQPSITSQESRKTIPAGTAVTIAAESTSKTVDMKSMAYTVESTVPNFTYSKTYTFGKNEYKHNVILKKFDQPGTYTVKVDAVDAFNQKASNTFTYVVEGSNETNVITFTPNKVSGSTFKINENFRVDIKSTLSSITKVSYEVKNANGNVVKTDSANVSSKETYINLTLSSLGTFTIKCNAVAADGTSKTETYTYTVEATGTLPDPVTPTDTITIKSSVSNGKTVGPETEVTFTATSNNRTIKKVIVYIDGDKETTETGSKSSLSATIKLPEDDGEYDVKVEAFDDNGKKETKTFTYTIDEDSDEDPKEGVIANDLEDLVIDLWRTSKSRFYELDDEVEFVAYYYNAESKSKKNVVIEVEIPDDFKVTEKNTDNGTASVSKDKLKFKLGTLEGKASGEVRFTIKATDDDVTNQITSITAVINSNTDDEEDSSTQLFWMYESGDKGTFNSYIVGYPDGTFRPDNAITREEVAAMFARAFKFNIYSNIKTFSDVSTTRWSYNYIVACAYKNVIKGYTDGTFKPNNNITRAELYTMTFRALGVSADEKALYVPKEYKKSDSWERDYVANLVRLSMLEDMDETAPDELATRAEVVYLINRVQFRNPSKTTTSIYSDVFNHWCAKDIESASITYSYKRSSSGKESIY